MKILFLSDCGLTIDLALRMKYNGHSVKTWIKRPDWRDIGVGIVEQVKDWHAWVGWADLVISDYKDLSDISDLLRKRGKRVYGNSAFSDKLEVDRKFGMQIMKQAGINTPENKSFNNAKEAIKYIQDSPSKYVLKFNSEDLDTYVGSLESGQDVIDEIERASSVSTKHFNKGIELQKCIEGIEVAAGCYFSGKDFVYNSTNINFEHKKRSNGGLGVMTGEMGTVIQFRQGDKLAQELYKVKDILAKENEAVCYDINFIATKDKVYGLEFTCRMGFPAIYIEEEAGNFDWAKFFYAIADKNPKEAEKFRFNNEYNLGIWLVTPNYPFESIYEKKYKNKPIYGVNKENIKNIHFWEAKVENNRFMTSGKTGSIMCLTDSGKTIKEAQDKVYGLAKKLYFTDVDYRTDIGDRVEKDIKQLQEWGWIK